MEQPGCTIGVDLGTTTAKVIAFDHAEHEVAHAEETLPLWHDASGAAEQDPAVVAEAATRLLAAVAREVRSRGYAIERVGLSAAMHSLLPVAEDGTPLAGAMTWMDTRPADEAAELWTSAQGKALYTRTGTPIHAMSPLVKLLWLRHQQPALFEEAVRFVSLKEWIWHRWMGAWEVDASIASATGLYNLAQAEWDAEALAMAEITPRRLSTPVATTTVRRGLRERALLDAGLTEETPFVVGASDGVLANLGVGAVGSDEMVVTIGTSCAVRAGAAQPLTSAETRTFCYVLDTGRFIIGGASNSGGIVLDWLFHDLLRGQALAPTPALGGSEEFTALLGQAAHAGDDELIVLPYVSGERAPLWDAHASGACVGLRVSHTAAHVLRAAVEGILFNAYWIADELVTLSGRPRRVLASGKVLEEEWIRQLAADIFGLPVVYRGAVDASAMGAALLAEIATGLRAWDDITGRHAAVDERILSPAGNRPYAQKYARFRHLATHLREGDT
jgi:gluconokinase